MSVFFNGRLIVTPAVATKIDDSAMANKNLTVPMNLAIIGRAASGEPKVAHSIGTPAEAQELFQDGELLHAIENAFSPSAMTGAPQTIIAIRVDPATQARFVLAQDVVAETGALQALGVDDNADYQVKLAADEGSADDQFNGYRIKMTSGNAIGETNLIEDFATATKLATCKYKWKNTPAAADTYELAPAALAAVSKDYGINANRTKIRVQAGTTAGKKITTAIGDDTVIQDDVAATYFTIQYTGAEESALMTVTASAISILAGDVGVEAEIYSCDLATYDTVEKVVDFFDALPDMSATANSDYATKPTVGKLDYVEETDIITDETNVTANLQAIVDYINSLAEPYLDAYRPTEAGAVPATIDYSFLMGGSATTPTADDWSDCLTALQTEDVQCIVPLTSTASIHAAADAHCIFMSNTAGQERRCIVGGALEETVDQVKTRAFNLNSDRTYICYPGVKLYDSDGDLTTYAPYMAAALLGGMVCGSDPGTSLTNKTLTIRGVETKLRNPTDTDELILGGVIPITSTPTGYKVIQSVSTWLPNDNYNRVEMATGFAVDYVARNVRNSLSDLIGRKGTPSILAEAVSRTENTLKELARPAPMGPEVITGDDDNPAYKSITATLEGDVLRVYFQCSPVVPVNYIPVGIAIQPYSGSASSA